jgi:hypothetical protein
MCVHVTNVFLMHDVFLIRASMSLCVPNVCVHVTITCMRACTHVHVPEPPCVYVYVCTHTHTHTHAHNLHSTDTSISTQPTRTSSLKPTRTTPIKKKGKHLNTNPHAPHTKENKKKTFHAHLGLPES